MGTTCRQDEDFLKSIIESTVLGKAIEWIQENLEPGDVFSDKDLEKWADHNYSTTLTSGDSDI